jgi:lipoprotein-anchoring transpeptidase ErfK/SrfK
MVRPMRRSWRMVSALAVVLVLSVTTACSGGGIGAQWQNPGATPDPEPTTLVLSPAASATDVSPADAVTVAVTGGTLETVTLTNADGKTVKGEFDSDMHNWKNTEPLGYNKGYTLNAVGVGPAGKKTEESRSFTTVKPKNFTLPYIRANVGMLLDGGTFGVGQVIVVWFDEPITDKAAAEKTLTVTADPPVVGAWSWQDSHEVHWRPKEYWPAHTKVKVDAKVYGHNLGNGLYGQEDRSSSFTIGQSKIAVADSNTKHMKVYIDGQQVTTINGHDVTGGIPISMGKGGSERQPSGQVVDFWTRSGPHIVMEKYESYHMTSASFGITNPTSPNFYDVNIKKSIRISYAGEFVHLADWNIPQQGVRNTSHGCINVAPTYIYWFFDTFGAGDVVDVQNTGHPLDGKNGNGPADWNVAWDQWVKGSALGGA